MQDRQLSCVHTHVRVSVCADEFACVRACVFVCLFAVQAYVLCVCVFVVVCVCGVCVSLLSSVTSTHNK